MGNGSSDVLLIKTDQQGQEEWIQTLGGGYIDIGNSIKQTSDNGYIITVIHSLMEMVHVMFG